MSQFKLTECQNHQEESRFCNVSDLKRDATFETQTVNIEQRRNYVCDKNRQKNSSGKNRSCNYHEIHGK